MEKRQPCEKVRKGFPAEEIEGGNILSGDQIGA